MKIKNYLEELLKIKNTNITYEEKNYELVHKLSDICKIIDEKKLEALKDKIFSNFDFKLYKSFLEYTCVADKNNLCNKNKNNGKKVEAITLQDFFIGYDQINFQFIKGHMFIEYYLKVILTKVFINYKALKNLDRTFSAKLNLLFAMGILDNKMYKYLNELNKIRNKLAHEITYNIDFEELFILVNLSAESGITYSDETIFNNKSLSKEWYGKSGIIQELIPNTCIDLINYNSNLFEEDEVTYLSMLYINKEIIK